VDTHLFAGTSEYWKSFRS